MIVDENSRSALHFAAGLGEGTDFIPVAVPPMPHTTCSLSPLAQGNVDCVKLLVEAGADVNLQDKEGAMPQHVSA